MGFDRRHFCLATATTIVTINIVTSRNQQAVPFDHWPIMRGAVAALPVLTQQVHGKTGSNRELYSSTCRVSQTFVFEQ